MQKRARATAAKTALIRVIRISLDLDHIAVFDISQDATVCVTEVAQRLHHLDAIGMDIDFRHLPSLSSRLLSYASFI